VISALILIGLCFAICLAATPLLLLVWVLHKWSKWVQRMVNGSDKDESKEALKFLAKMFNK
jgi:hypothetical protein